VIVALPVPFVIDHVPPAVASVYGAAVLLAPTQRVAVPPLITATVGLLVTVATTAVLVKLSQPLIV